MRNTVCFELGMHGSQRNIPASCNHCREDVGTEIDILDYHCVLWDQYNGTPFLQLIG